MTAAIRVGDLIATDVSRIHVTATDNVGRRVCDVAATVIAIDWANSALICKTDDGREVRVPVDVETRPVGGAR